MKGFSCQTRCQFATICLYSVARELAGCFSGGLWAWSWKGWVDFSCQAGMRMHLHYCSLTCNGNTSIIRLFWECTCTTVHTYEMVTRQSSLFCLKCCLIERFPVIWHLCANLTREFRESLGCWLYYLSFYCDLEDTHHAHMLRQFHTTVSLSNVWSESWLTW